MATIGLGEDVEELERMLERALLGEGYEVLRSRSIESAINGLSTGRLDLLLLNLALPDPQRLQVLLREIRGRSEVPVIVLWAQQALRLKIAALNAGADDVVEEPFCIEEILARIRTLLRRWCGSVPQGLLRFGGLEMDLRQRLVHLSGKRVLLTPTEYRLLEVFVTNPGRVLSHRWLLERVWGNRSGADVSYLRVYVRQLRQKLMPSGAKESCWIGTEPGVGYRWLMEAEDADHGCCRG